MSSYPKGNKDAVNRRSRPRKRKFYGNQYSNSKDSKLSKESEETEQPSAASASARKLFNVSSEDVHYNPLHCYRFIEFFTVFSALSEFLICRECKQTVKFEEASHRGLGFMIVVLCRCGRRDINSGPLVKNGYEINRRIVFVMRLLGIAREGINLFCNLMDVCDGLSKSAYNNIVTQLYTVTKSVFQSCCKKAVEEEKQENEKHERPISNLKVSGDGSWKKRGFKSLYGVTTLIGYYSDKVIDLIIKSSYCSGCNYWKNKQDTEEYREWYEGHMSVCQENHQDSSGAIEVESIKEMFLRSEELFGVKYGNYIGDGDSKTFKAILDVNPYGDDFQIIKNECIEHVQKRMESRLRKINKERKLDEKGKLTDALINKLTVYYGLAIQRNINSLEDMKKAIMATYDHMCSTDENPKHENCPPGSDSWCKWRKAEAFGEDTKLITHTAPLHPEVQQHIKPIFEELSRDDLLQRCLGGHTQNANECFNTTVWNLAPKHLYSGTKIIEIAAYIAVALFNEGYASILKMMNNSEIIIGRQCKNYADKYDDNWVKRQKRQSLSSSKEARKAQIEELTDRNEFFERTEGLLYGAGISN